MPNDAYTFELAWRWTQPTHNVLPADVMAQIRPLERCSAPPGLSAAGELNKSLFVEIHSTRTDGSAEEVADWLRQLPVPPAELVAVRWGEYTAIETTWEVFVQYWDDFCYPSSDDIEVFPASEAWILLYYHFELFDWGRRRT